MWKLTKIIFIILIGLGAIFLIGSYYSEKKLEEFKELFNQERFSQFKSIMPEEEGLKEFTSPDGKLKVTYLSNWREIKDEIFLKEIISGEIADEYNLEVLFLAQKLEEEKFSQLAITKGIFDNQESFEEIVDIIKGSDQKKGWETEIVNSETKNNENTFEAKYKKADRPEFHSQEKIILANQEEGEVYIITVSTLEKDWRYFKEEINNIINSVQLID